MCSFDANNMNNNDNYKKMREFDTMVAMNCIRKPNFRRLFVRGAAGTGKTEFLTRATIEVATSSKASRVLCLLPNQTTYENFVDEWRRRRDETDVWCGELDEPQTVMLLDELECLLWGRGYDQTTKRMTFDEPLLPHTRILIAHNEHSMLRTFLAARAFTPSALILDAMESLDERALLHFIRRVPATEEQSGAPRDELRLIGALDHSNECHQPGKWPASGYVTRTPQWTSRHGNVTRHASEHIAYLDCARDGQTEEHDAHPNWTMLFSQSTRPDNMLTFAKRHMYPSLRGSVTQGQILFTDTAILAAEGVDVRSKTSPSSEQIWNRTEARLAVEHAERLIAHGARPQTIVILAKFAEHVVLTRLMLKDSVTARDVRCGRLCDFKDRAEEHVIFAMTASTEDHKLTSHALHWRDIWLVLNRALKTLVWIGDSRMLAEASGRHADNLRSFHNYLTGQQAVVKAAGKKRITHYELIPQLT